MCAVLAADLSHELHHCASGPRCASSLRAQRAGQLSSHARLHTQTSLHTSAGLLALLRARNAPRTLAFPPHPHFPFSSTAPRADKHNAHGMEEQTKSTAPPVPLEHGCCVAEQCLRQRAPGPAWAWGRNSCGSRAIPTTTVCFLRREWQSCSHQPRLVAIQGEGHVLYEYRCSHPSPSTALEG